MDSATTHHTRSTHMVLNAVGEQAEQALGTREEAAFLHELSASFCLQVPALSPSMMSCQP